MNRLAAVGLLVVLFAGCGGDSTGPSQSVSLTGSWSFSGSISNSSVQVTCSSSGPINITQSGTAFNGTYSTGQTCTGPGGTTSGSASGTFGGGQISGTQVNFTDDGGCSYSGTASGSPTNRVNGPVTCNWAYSGQNYTFTGTWQATR